MFEKVVLIENSLPKKQIELRFLSKAKINRIRKIKQFLSYFLIGLPYIPIYFYFAVVFVDNKKQVIKSIKIVDESKTFSHKK